MDTLQLKMFISISQTLNFTKTAAEFYVSQPTVSNYVKALEANVGVKLLNRDSHSVSLTQEGKEFVSYASRILALQMEAESRLKNMTEGRRGLISVAMLSSCAMFFTRCMEEFAEKFPEVQVNVKLLEGSEMTASIAKGKNDIYFAHRHMLPDNSSVQYTQLGTSHLRLYVHRDIAGEIDLNDWKTIERFRFVSTPVQDFTLSGQIDRMCEKHGIRPNIINYYNRADMAYLAVNAGVGIAILPAQLQTFYNCPNVVGLEIDEEDALITHVIAWQKENVNPEVASFLSLNSLKDASSYF